MMPSVLPSGVAVATNSVPSALPAPGWVSTTMVGPPVALICWPRMRMALYAGPPGANGRMIFIVRLLCGHAAVAIDANAITATKIAAKRARLSLCIWFLPIGPNADVLAAKSYTVGRWRENGRKAGAWHIAAPAITGTPFHQACESVVSPLPFRAIGQEGGLSHADAPPFARTWRSIDADPAARCERRCATDQGH